MTKEEAIENVKTAKRELKHQLSREGVQMKGWGKASAYNTIAQLLHFVPQNIELADTKIFNNEEEA
jgi:hypothetical protein